MSFEKEKASYEAVKKLSKKIAGLGALSAFARAKVDNETTISEKCGSSDDLVKNHFSPPLCVAITRCAAMVWELKKCKQSQ